MSDEFYMKGEPMAPPDRFKAMQDAADELVKLDLVIQTMEEDLAAAKSLRHRIATITLPEKMAELQITEVTIGNRTVELNDLVAGSLPKDQGKRKLALDYLETIEGGGIVKTKLSVDFPKHQREDARKIAAWLKEQGVVPDVKEDVHAQTLMSFVRNKLKNGDPIEPERLGVFVGKIVKIKEAKE
jgi:hypothetical protein